MISDNIITTLDWEAFRAEAAKDIMCAMLTDQRISETKPYKDLVRMSLECTDELIKQLKEKEVRNEILLKTKNPNRAGGKKQLM